MDKNQNAFTGRRTYITASIGILIAVGAYIIGEIGLFDAFQTIFTLGGIYFLRKSSENKRNKNGKHSRKISE